MINVLIIEDHGVVRAGLSDLLNAEKNMTVCAAVESGSRALQLMNEGIKPDVLLADLHLGDMTGIELSSRVLKRWPETKTMILTMETDQRYLFDAFREGVKGYVLKEAGFDELIYGIKKVRENRHFICTGSTIKLSERLASQPAYKCQKASEVALSRRESEILHLLADGYTNMQIADKLFTSKRTVEGHRQSLLIKTGVHNTPELIKYALLNGLLQVQVA